MARGNGKRLFVLIAAVIVLGSSISAAILTSRHAQPPPSGKILITPPPAPAGYFVEPHGRGNCVTSPCGSINAAVAQARARHTANAVVELATGEYPGQTISVPTNTASAETRVTVRSARGANVTMPSLAIEAPNVVVHRVTVTGPVRLTSTATGSGLEDITTDGGSVFIGASNSFIEGSRITPAVDADGIQIKAYDGKNPSGVRIEHTVVGPTHRGPKRTHVDCIQILAGSDIVIRYDTLFHCADQGIIVGSGASGTVSGTIDVQRTQIQLCPSRTSDCDGYNAIHIKAPKVVFVHNTVIDGGAVFDVPDLTLAANYFESLSTCSGTIEGNLIADTKCDALAASNRRGQLKFVAPDSSPPNLTPVKPVVLPDSKQWLGDTFAPAAQTRGALATGGAAVGAVDAVKAAS
jgi:hypothetical protein